MLSFPIVVPVPFMTYDEYARHTGMTPRTVADWASKGTLIIKKKDRPKETPLVNVLAMHELAIREARELMG